jgi:hypothetical protein
MITILNPIIYGRSGFGDIVSVPGDSPLTTLGVIIRAAGVEQNFMEYLNPVLFVVILLFYKGVEHNEQEAY